MGDLKTAPYAAFLLRVISGIIFLAHGLTKVFPMQEMAGDLQMPVVVGSTHYFGP